MSKKLKKRLIRIIIALGIFVPVVILDLSLKHFSNGNFPRGIASFIPSETFGWLLPFAIYLGIYIYIGYDVIKKAILNIIHGQLLDENFLMFIATVGAFALGIYTSLATSEIEGFEEGCAVILFYQVGEWFQSYAVGKSRKSIASLMDIRPDFANLKINDKYEIVDPSEVKINDIILIKPGEKIPLDGEIIVGSTTVDTKALTGESIPQELLKGDKVISGTINLTSSIEVKVEKPFYDSTVSKILDLVENASSQKSKSEAFITKFAKYYTPIVVICALIVAIFPPLINGILGDWNTWHTWIYSALSFLVVSCPCALVISVPLTFFSGIGGASKNGILVKGSIHLERFDKANIFIFDKTGTLTKGNFVVKEIYPENNKESILYHASIAESLSNHPIAKSIKKAYGKEIINNYSIVDEPGYGIVATGEHQILCGNEKLMNKYNIQYQNSNGIGTIVHVAIDNKYLGYIVIGDEVKEDSKETISYLNNHGYETIMLTGDNELIASHVAKQLGIKQYRYSLLPQNKVEEVEKIILNKNKDDVVCFVGDGINDAPVLMRSDVGVSMGGVGSDAAIEASDIVLMHDNLSSLVTAKKLAKKTKTIVVENIIFAIAIKLLIMIASIIVIGILQIDFPMMWFSVFGDVGVAVIAILNAMRANINKSKYK